MTNKLPNQFGSRLQELFGLKFNWDGKGSQMLAASSLKEAAVITKIATDKYDVKIDISPGIKNGVTLEMEGHNGEIVFDLMPWETTEYVLTTLNNIKYFGKITSQKRLMEMLEKIAKPVTPEESKELYSEESE